MEISRFLDGLSRRSHVLLIEGEVGIGKTTLLTYGRNIATKLEYTVLSANPVEAEMSLALTGLADLFEMIPASLLDVLPGPQEHAIRQAVLRIESSRIPIDPRTTAMATLAFFRNLAEARPAVIMIDDLPWLDRASASVLSFALRRLKNERIGLVATVRTGWPGDPRPHAADGIPAHCADRLTIGPLGLGEMRQLLATRTGMSPTRSRLLRLHETSGGNPLLALELATRVNQVIPFGTQSTYHYEAAMRRPVLNRLNRLSPGSRDILLVCSLATDASHPVICAAARNSATAFSDLEEGIRAGILRRASDNFAFAHPIMRLVIAEEADSSSRRAAHRRLAAVVPSFEERARHLALGAEAPDEAVAAVVEDAARMAARRGACYRAADLAELAAALTPLAQAEERCQRTTLAAEQWFQASDPAHACSLLEGIIDTSRPGPMRARLLRCLGRYRLFRGEPLAAWASVLRQALTQAGGDPALRARILLDQAVAASNTGEFADAIRFGALALEGAEQADDKALQGQCCAGLALVSFMAGEGVREGLISRALASPEQPPTLSMELRPNVAVGHILHWAGNLDGARACYGREYARAVEEGTETSLPMLLWAMAENEGWAGNWQRARHLVTEGYSAAEDSGVPLAVGFMSAVRGLLLAYQGDIDSANHDGTRAVELAQALGIPLLAIIGAQVFGIAALSAGDARGAHERLAPFAEPVLAHGMKEPALYRFLPDEIEALTRLGELDTAEALLAPFRSRSAQLDREWGTATAERCRGLLLGAHGDLPGAEKAIEAALAAHRQLTMPFEEARTFLAAGEVHRRARHKHASLGFLQAACSTFEDLGAPLWAARAREEIARVGMRRPRPESHVALTAAERSVAALAAAGQTNLEIAAELFMGRRTVEAHLSRVYRKLSVRSRTELCRVMISAPLSGSR
jgi:DNA-binding CsgD family transcriptional regulator